MVSAFECHLRPCHHFLGFSSLNSTDSQTHMGGVIGGFWLNVKERPSDFNYSKRRAAGRPPIDQSAGKRSPLLGMSLIISQKFLSLSVFWMLAKTKVGLVTAAFIHQTLGIGIC